LSVLLSAAVCDSMHHPFSRTGPGVSGPSRAGAGVSGPEGAQV